MPLAILTLFTGLAISAIAIYYSVIGLAAIFSAAVIPIMVMGAILEISKLVAAWWLKANWGRAPILLKSYMLVSVIVLMLITSMGIFGFLSKAHSDQAITTGDVVSQVALYDEQIKVERDNIENAKSLISQMDATVQGIIANGESREIKLRDGRTYMRSAAEQALQVRRSQAKDRAQFTEIIEQSQAKILELQQKKAPVAANLREVEAKVGPIKYIAQLIYGEDPDQNLLEKAVTWVIITIVFVFDPLAVLLLLASQMSFQWARQEKERKDELVQADSQKDVSEERTELSNEIVTGPVDARDSTQPADSTAAPDPDEGNKKLAEIDTEFIEPVIPEEAKEKDAVSEWNELIAEAEKAVEQENTKETDEIDDEADEYENDPEHIKEAKKAWKHDHPSDSLKRQKKLFERGMIKKLPWEVYIKAEPDYMDQDAVEAAKWAQEQLDKTSYTQNEEQNKETTIWNKIKDSKKDD